jgi:hypothetical protein
VNAEITREIPHIDGSQGIGVGHVGQVSDIIFLEPPLITGEIPPATAARSPATDQAPGE